MKPRTMVLYATLLALTGCGSGLLSHGNSVAKGSDDPQPDACKTCANEENACGDGCLATWYDDFLNICNPLEGDAWFDCLALINQKSAACAGLCRLAGNVCLDKHKCPRPVKGR